MFVDIFGAALLNPSPSGVKSIEQLQKANKKYILIFKCSKALKPKAICVTLMRILVDLELPSCMLD